ncbi:MAG: DUF4345 domain-containing protein [Pseudomonadota bacterium]|nr:DUF4345 domain-containing protein [Pseudomonadota bacterium]
MKTIATIYASILLLMGLAYVFAPGILFSSVGGTLEAGAATTDFRATYGGAHIALGFFCLLRRSNANDLYGTFILLSAVMGFVGIVRIAGVLLDGGAQTLNILASTSEIASGCLMLYCAGRVRRDIKSPNMDR